MVIMVLSTWGQRSSLSNFENLMNFKRAIALVKGGHHVDLMHGVSLPPDPQLGAILRWPALLEEGDGGGDTAGAAKG